MTPEQTGQLNRVNAEVNAIPFNELPGPGEPPDWWTDQPMAGRSFVCRDYTQMKADRLRALGWPAASLTVILCWVEPPPPPGGGYHAVLGVEDGADTWILDSRWDVLYPMAAPPLAYTWDRRQIPGTIEYEDIGA